MPQSGGVTGHVGYDVSLMNEYEQGSGPNVIWDARIAVPLLETDPDQCLAGLHLEPCECSLSGTALCERLFEYESMPELPEVEIFRQVADSCRGRAINHASIADPGILEGIPAQDLERLLKGEYLRSSRRHGKHLFLELSGAGTLAMHFGMNGSLKLVSESEPGPSYARLQLYFEKGDRLVYVNPRRLGRVSLAENAEAFIAETDLGPDVLDAAFNSHAFEAILASSKRDIKSVLMDQALMAGIGNIYSDEILFQARVFPGTAANQLKGKRATELFRAMRKTLQSAINSGAGSEQGVERLPKGFLLTQRHPGGLCPRCGALLETVKHGGRTGYYCHRCQPK